MYLISVSRIAGRIAFLCTQQLPMRGWLGRRRDLWADDIFRFATRRGTFSDSHPSALILTAINLFLGATVERKQHHPHQRPHERLRLVHSWLPVYAREETIAATAPASSPYFGLRIVCGVVPALRLKSSVYLR